jgi:hypothetical protein
MKRLVRQTKDMKTRYLKVTVVVIVTVLVITFMLWLIWLPVTASWMVRQNAKQYHDMYQPGEEMYACIHNDEFAIWFAGTKGLPAIEKLSKDESLIPSARSSASNLYVYISSGQHLPSIRRILASNPYWLDRQFGNYLVKKDTVYLKEQIPPNN